MSETKHTPAPWIWEDWNEDGGENTNHLTADPKYREDYANAMFPDLRCLILNYEDDISNKADKYLIAAAPDLLEACEEAKRILDGGDGYCPDIIEKAIKKAKGEK